MNEHTCTPPADTPWKHGLVFTCAECGRTWHAVWMQTSDATTNERPTYAKAWKRSVP